MYEKDPNEVEAEKGKSLFALYELEFKKMKEAMNKEPIDESTKVIEEPKPNTFKSVQRTTIQGKGDKETSNNIIN